MAADYNIEHWTSTRTTAGSTREDAIAISVDNRAATRQAIINRVRSSGMSFVERSDWAAHKNRSERMRDDWNYTKIAIQITPDVALLVALLRSSCRTFRIFK